MGASNRLGNNGGRSYDFLFQPVKIDCNFVVDNTQPNGIRALKGAGVQNVYMYSSAPGASNPLTDASASAGIAWVQLANNYYRYAGGFSGFASPSTGSPVAINGSALTVGKPYVIATVGVHPAGAVTIAPQADTAGSLAGSYFNLYDGYGNNYLMWIYVTGVGGSAPVGVSGVPVQVTIASGATAANITTAISAVALALSDSQPAGVHLPSGVAPFTSSGAGGATLTLTSTGGKLIPGPPQAGVIAGTAWTFAQTIKNTNRKCWQGVGLPAGVDPAVGASFIATSAGVSVGGGSTGTVLAVSASGISSVEVIGDANASLGPIPVGGSPNVGGWVMVQFLGASAALTGSALGSHTHDLLVIGGQAASTTNDVAIYSGPILGKEQAANSTVLGSASATNGGVVAASAGTPAGTIAVTYGAKAPAAGSVCGLSFFVESKSVIVAGE